MKIGVMSDTHEHIENVGKALAVFAEHNVEYIIHLGDFCAGPTIRACKDAPAQLIGILGNNDGDVGRMLHNYKDIGGDLWPEEFRALDLGGKKIACYHGTVAAITEALINCGTYDLVLYGHTHTVDQRTVSNTLILNPGSVHGFDTKATIGIVDLGTMATEVIDL